MSDNMPNPTDWVHIYQHTLSRSPPPPPPPPSTTVSGGGTTTPTTSFSTSPSHGPLGRGSRPIRRRSRASRRNPTTVFNTDTRNFRAMVQQFTGNQTGPFDQSQGPIQFFGPRNINPSLYNIQFQQQVQQNQQQVQQNLPYTSIPPPQGQIGETNFFHGLGNTSSSRSNMEVFENLAMDDRINNPLPRQHQRGRD
ncbi:VQ motif-containing protein 22-like [Lycium ferocissimum]|uniref:VQ motif-containing protein 22-like n=1 Tax=Lycium ferocissimum TaxID=112874 RepID=UPI002815857C|nr:VQ motif-containing protein 22-like [Lycium ferocissimum]